MPGDVLFHRVHAVMQGEPNHRGWYDADCPFCAKPRARGSHFGYRREGFHCFVCGASGSLMRLAGHLNLTTSDDRDGQRQFTRHRTAAVASRSGSGRRHTPDGRTLSCQDDPPPWRQEPHTLLAAYRAHPERYNRWQDYKPLSRATLDRHDFGLGRLPFRAKNGAWYRSADLWLTVPLWQTGELMGLAGRNLGSRGPKWMCATGTRYTLWGVDRVVAGSVCWLVENYVDACWIVETYPEWSAVACGGATTWRTEWATQLAARRPEIVIVALDHDLVGNAAGSTRRRMEMQWRRRHGQEPPPGNGVKIANNLLRAGQQTTLFTYPDGTPDKADIGWLLRRELGR